METYIIGYEELSSISDSIQNLKIQRLKSSNLEKRLDASLYIQDQQEYIVEKLKQRDSLSTIEIDKLNRLVTEQNTKLSSSTEYISKQDILLKIKDNEILDLRKQVIKKNRQNGFFKIITPALAFTIGILLLK